LTWPTPNDVDSQRVKGTVNHSAGSGQAVATVYVAGVYEWQGGATTLYYEGNALRRSGYASDNGVFYLLQDHLNSSSAFVTQSGAVTSRNSYFPFGGNRGGAAFSGLTTKRFTGQYHEASLPGGEGLSYYGARWYDAQLGRFLSADSIVPGPANPQAFNRYSYVLNSPMNRIDPTGHYDVRPGDAHLRGTVPREPWFLKPLRWIAAFREAQEKVNRMYGSDLGGNLILGIALIKHDEYRMYGRTPPAGLQLTHEWYHELGAKLRKYGPEYEITQWLSGAGPYGVPAEGVQEATQQYWARNGQDVKGESAYSYPFGASDFLEELDKALNNGEWSGSFLGSYRVEIKTINRIATDVSLVEYTVYNKTGWESGTRYPFPKWLRNEN
jgi:RHS repeat-associated protein